jgi:hypothetical protein
MRNKYSTSKKSGNTPNKIETNDFREKRTNRSISVFKKLSADGICLLFLTTLKEL